jgi:hypothetical protein
MPSSISYCDPPEIGVRIPTKPAMHSNLKPATCSDAKPARDSDLMPATLGVVSSGLDG